MTYTWYPLIRGNHSQFILNFFSKDLNQKYISTKILLQRSIYRFPYNSLIYICTCFCEYRRVCLKDALMDEMHSLSCYWKTGMCLFVIYSLMVWLMIMSSKLFSCLSIIIPTINLFWRYAYLCITNVQLRCNFIKYIVKVPYYKWSILSPSPSLG